MNNKVQIVTSALNEGGNIIEFCHQLQSVFQKESNYVFDVLIFDNASTDDTWLRIKEVAVTDSRFRGFLMSRQFTLDASLTAGIDLADGDAVITMASDLQDEPEKISDFLRAWEHGNNLVLGRVTERPELSLAFKVLTPIYYKIASWASNGLLYENVSDYRLMSRAVYTNVRRLREQHRYMRGLTSWTGFNPCFIDLKRKPRFSGKSNNRLFPVLSLATKGILSQSSKPLTMISLVGFTLPLFFFSLFITFLALWVVKGVPFSGFGSIISLLLFLFSLNFLFLGIIGQYIALISTEVKNRPLYIISEVFEGSK